MGLVRGKIVGRNSLTVVLREVVYEPVIAMLPGIFAPNSTGRVERYRILNIPRVVTPLDRKTHSREHVPSVKIASIAADQAHPRPAIPVGQKDAQTRAPEV